MHEQCVLVRARVQADVADEEVAGFVLVAETAGPLHRREVQAGLRQFGDVLYRQVVQGALVLLAGEHETIRINRIGDLCDRLPFAPVPAVARVQLVAAALAVLLVGGEEVRDLVVAHAQEFDIDFLDVDRNDRQAARLARGQHISLRGESGGRFHRSGVDLLVDVRAEGLAVGGCEVTLDAQRVARIGAHVREAQRLAILVEGPAALDRGTLRIGDRQQRIERLRANQWTVEFQRDRELTLVLLRTRGGEHKSLGRFRRCGVGHDRRLALHVRHLVVWATAREQGERNDDQHNRSDAPQAGRG
jgi:hypothetical protein